MQSVEKNIQWYQSKFQAFEQGLNGEKSTPLHAMRRNAIQRFAEIGFPTNRHEDWRFTNISPITKIEFQPISGGGSQRITKEDIRPYIIDGTIRLVIVNGIFSKDYSDLGSLPNGMLAGSLTNILKTNPDLVQPYVAHLVRGDENAFTALNTAFLQDGAFVYIPHGIILDRPIHFIFLATDNEDAFVSQPRNIIIAENDSKFKLIESYIGLSKNTYLTNAVTELNIGKNSVIEHENIQLESVNSYHVGTTNIKMDRSSSYTSNVISLGGSIIRNNITAVLDAEGAECTLNGLSLGSGTQIIDNHTAIDHAKPHCSSHELYKAILGGASKGIFNGKIFVRKDAQKTDAKQTNKTLLLSDDASINTKPQLEIFADDVKCTHGATIGQLDAEQIFYLRTRGIGIAEARAILTYAFAGDVLNRITIDSLRDSLEQTIQERLSKNLM